MKGQALQRSQASLLKRMAHELRGLLFLFLFLLLVTDWKYSSAIDGEERKVYVVYMGNRGITGASASSLHLDILSSTVNPLQSKGNISELLIHSYKRSFNGFSAYLTEQEATKMASMEGIVSVFPSQSYKPSTTRSWDFIGLPLNVSRTTTSESNIIIGVIDTGIWPESQSFNDKGIGSPPSKWKGTCQSSKTFKCNNKIIGARYYKGRGDPEQRTKASPRDTVGHGTHMASSAAGREVVGASFYGLAEGVARGGVPSARIAVYKACWTDPSIALCADEDVLAAFDDAIADGVDLILAAMARGYATPYFQDALAIGSFHAMQRGILTSAPSTDFGNEGMYGVVANSAPWILTVAASTIDREFMNKLVLGDGSTYMALELNSFASQRELLPLIYGGDAPNAALKFFREISKNCSPGSLDRRLVRDKIVVCDRLLSAGSGAELAGAAGYIFSSGSAETCRLGSELKTMLPAICLGTKQFAQVKNYMRSTRNPRGRILRSWTIHDPTAPTVYESSANGPSYITPDLLKPDIAAPGVGILAAWSPKGHSFPKLPVAGSAVFNLFSGTSAAAAHAVGLAAYVKSFHTTWSPAAVRSALMTTALPMTYPPDHIFGPLAYGAGQIHAKSVLDPGLVYDAHEHDYVSMLCKQGYDSQMLRAITGDLKVCSHTTNGTVWDLNYPSILLTNSNISESFNATFQRIVTNVGSPNSTYRAIIENHSPRRFQIDVEPTILSFNSMLEKKSFVVHVRGIGRPRKSLASLTWTDEVHHVRSPILACFRKLAY